ncbi:hypothetical protein OPV22_033028 [Ensete ventricosum]|uniref:Uncharacterized protein n=1 Tax=Ensete ventricosum TaxID=4639 RepID=A0AAV8PX25_ENSVE|nr:hypothetical protein OPV22_033028 [Ensete ventricosum]
MKVHLAAPKSTQRSQPRARSRPTPTRPPSPSPAVWPSSLAPPPRLPRSQLRLNAAQINSASPNSPRPQRRRRPCRRLRPLRSSMPPHILVPGAGVGYARFPVLADTGVDAWDAIFGVNARSNDIGFDAAHWYYYHQVCAGATSNQQIKLAARKDCTCTEVIKSSLVSSGSLVFQLPLRFKMRHMLHLRIYQSIKKSERTSNGMVDCCIEKRNFSLETFPADDS